MKLPVHPLGPLALVLGAAVVATVRPAPAVVYPANACVSTKQKGAGGFCEGVLRAWAGFEGDGNAGKRDAALQRAAAELVAEWSAADAKALAKGTDCAETTLAVTAAESLIDSAVGAIVDDVNIGLNPDGKRDARCGSKILVAAASLQHTTCLLHLRHGFRCPAVLDPFGGIFRSRQPDHLHRVRHAV